MQFEFATSNRIVFGEGAIRQLPEILASLGIRRVLLVSGKAGISDALAKDLDVKQVEVFHFESQGEPELGRVEKGIFLAREMGVDGVVGLGGGSAVDLGKAIAAIAQNPGNLLDYLEVVGKGRVIQNPPLPFIAIPTTAGTGSEVTRNAVISVATAGMKVSLRSPLMLPRVALIDPELTYPLPPDLTASTGMDALTQLLEPYVSTRSHPLTDLYCREGIRLAALSLRAAYRNGFDREARANMAYASLLGGLALANAGLGAVHGFASPIGGRFAAPHGAVCARLLPDVVRMNVSVIKRIGSPDHPVLKRYAEIGRIISGNPEADGLQAADWLEDLNRELQIPPLSEYEIRPEHLATISAGAAAASSMKTNPVVLNDAELQEILQRALF